MTGSQPAQAAPAARSRLQHSVALLTRSARKSPDRRTVAGRPLRAAAAAADPSRRPPRGYCTMQRSRGLPRRRAGRRRRTVQEKKKKKSASATQRRHSRACARIARHCGLSPARARYPSIKTALVPEASAPGRSKKRGFAARFFKTRAARFEPAPSQKSCDRCFCAPRLSRGKVGRAE